MMLNKNPLTHFRDFRVFIVIAICDFCKTPTLEDRNDKVVLTYVFVYPPSSMSASIQIA
jgi:hypothetical protein